MFECIESDMYEFSAVGSCFVGKLKKGVEFCDPYTRSGASVIQAPSVGAYIDYLEKHCPTPKQNGESSKEKSRSYQNDFYHFNGYEETLDVFKNRPYEIRKFEPEDEQLAVPDESGKDVFYDVTGDFIDIERAIEGVPEAFGNFSMGNPSTMFATVIINTMAVWSTPSAALEARAVRLLRLVDWLEHQKIRTQVKLLSTNECFYSEIAIKEFDQYMDLDNLAIAANTDFFRRLQFRFMEYSPTWQSGYGIATTVESGRMRFPKKLRDQQGIFLFTENHTSVAKVHQSFDMTHKAITSALADGQRNISISF